MPYTLIMSIEAEAVFSPQGEPPERTPEVNQQEKNRLIAHLGRVFARNYDIQVIPSRQKGLWATSLDPKVNIEVHKYIDGQRETLDDLPPESFRPKQILYDAESAQNMTMDEINTILHHEAGHAKYTDFRLMFEGQRQAKDEGNLPSSFWITFEGIEDPRVNSLEGEESPAIDRQIRTNQGNELQKRITEAPLKDKPLMLQFVYNSFHHWLHGEGIAELKGSDVDKAYELAKPLLDQYFQNTDVEQRKLLQRQIWDIAKGLEKQDIEDEQKRQMAQQQQQNQGQGQESGDQQGQGQPGQGEGQQFGGQGGDGEGQAGTPSLPGGKGSSGNQQKNFLDKLKESLFGPRNKQGQQGQNQSNQQNSQEQEGQSQDSFGHDIKPTQLQGKPKPERFDLSQLSDQELQQLKDAIDNLSPEERTQLEKRAREVVDELQKEALEEDINKNFKLEKNKKTGDYEVKPQLADESVQKQAQENYQHVLKEVEAEEQAEQQRQELERQVQEAMMRQLEQAKREKLEMEKAGFKENEKDEFLVYQSLEDSMESYVRRFKQAIEKVVPRRGEPRYEGGFFSGSKFDRRDLVRRAPLENEQFWQRQTEAPTGDPRLFIGLLVDNSGSMSGKKIEEARKVMIFFAKVSRDMGIPFMMGSFGSNANAIKTFRQDFDNAAERIKPRLLQATNASEESTNLHAGIELTVEAMNDQRRRLKDSHGLIFVITDGKANKGLTNEALRDYIEENRGRFTYKAFGLSNNETEKQQIQNYLNLYFGESNCAYPQGFEDLPDEAFRVLRINLMQFQRFLS